MSKITPGLWLLTMLLALISAAPTCAPIEDADGATAAELDVDPGTAAKRLALDRLALHDIRGAHDDFNRALTHDPSSGEALAGLALTKTLLLPEHPTLQALFAELGGQPMDAQDNLYGDNGLLALYASRAARSRVEERLDESLPWTQAEIDNLDLLVDKLDPALNGNDIADNLVEIADELINIAELLSRAARDPEFAIFAFPRTTFFGNTFIGLRKAEILALDGALRSASAAILWLAAYDWDLKAEQLRAEVPLKDRIATVNAVAFKTIRAPERLVFSKNLTKQAMEKFGRAVTEGFDTRLPGSLVWSALAESEVLALTTFFRDLILSINAPTANTAEPGIELHLGALFDGRTLDDTQQMFETFEGPEGEQAWGIDFDTLHAVLISGVITPGCHPDPAVEDPECPDFFTEGPASKNTLDRVVGPLIESVQDDYRF